MIACGERTDEDRGLRLCAAIRTQSPSAAPPLTGLDGSTVSTPICGYWSGNEVINALTSDDLPAPGCPVTPNVRHRALASRTARRRSAPSGVAFSAGDHVRDGQRVAAFHVVEQPCQIVLRTAIKQALNRRTTVSGTSGFFAALC